jgi:glycerate kinase
VARRTPRVVVASDAFKGSLTSAEVGDAVAAGLRDALPDVRVTVVPVADGGEGTVAAALASGFRAVCVRVHGPTGDPVDATLAVRDGPDGRTVVVEMADACGSGRLPGGVPAPLTASSRGLGDAIRGALDLSPDTVVVGVGGSASTDGGVGVLVALGAEVTDADGRPVRAGGAGLADAAHLDRQGIDPRLRSIRLVLAADVDSPLHGPNGAAHVFAPQKGATTEEVEALDRALTAWGALVDPGSTSRPGAGAAGGVGFALLALLGAERRPGVDVVLDLVGLDDALAGAALVVTGEGTLDSQTLAGKAVTGVVRRAAAFAVPVVAVCGLDRLAAEAARPLGLAATYPLSDLEADLHRSMTDARDLLRRTASRIATDWLTGRPG